ncbi:MAG TPA: hypothetical protein VFD27_05245 [Chthoniobacteraceae bacterium]|jgi:hypothetical protein|nr:hypothetical protein [Chthoniobacteraceae bacterium]
MNRLAYFARWSLPMLNDYKLGRAMKATVLRLVTPNSDALCSTGAKAWIDFLMRFP